MKVFSLQAPIYRGAWLSRLSPSLQSHKASPSPWRSHSSRVPLNHQPGDRPVSYGLNSDTNLRHSEGIANLRRSAQCLRGLAPEFDLDLGTAH